MGLCNSLLAENFPFIYDVISLKRHWAGNQQGMSYLMGEGTSSALVRHPSSDDVIIKMSYGVDLLLNQSALHPTFSY